MIRHRRAFSLAQLIELLLIFAVGPAMVVVEHGIPDRMVLLRPAVELYREEPGDLRIDDMRRAMDVADQMDDEFNVEGYGVFWVHVPVLEPIEGSHDRIHAI